MSKAKNIGAYGEYADKKYSAPITDNDVQDCFTNAKGLLKKFKDIVKQGHV